MVKKYPKTDMRIFYENMKTLKIEIVESTDSPYASASYNVIENIIRITEDYVESVEDLYHELAHAYHQLYIDNDIPMYRYEFESTALSEAMTNEMIEGLIKEKKIKMPILF